MQDILTRRPYACSVYVSSGCGRIELALTLADAQSASHQGQCDDDVAALLEVPYVAAQVAEWDQGMLREVLREYGAWDAAELGDDAANRARMLWLLAGDIVDQTFGEE